MGLLLRDRMLRQLYRLGDLGARSAVEHDGEFGAKIVTESVVLALGYDWKDCWIYGTYRSPEDQVAYESATTGRLRIYDSSDTPFTLLRHRGFVSDLDSRWLDLEDQLALDDWMATLFDALREHAADMLRGEAKGLGVTPIPPDHPYWRNYQDCDVPPRPRDQD